MKNIKKDLMICHIKSKSFTLIELLVVIVIIGILAGVITLSVSSNISKAQDLKVSSTILSVSKALKADSLDSFPIETVACNLKNSCTTLKSRIDLPNITEDIYYKSSSSGEFFVIYGNKPSNTSLGFEITSIDEKVKEVPSFDNLVAYYPLAAGTKNGTAISDMSPNSNNGTNSGASSASGVDGNIGTAMSFDGTNDYVNSSITGPIAIYTLSGWFFRSDALGSFGTIIGSQTDARPTAGFELESITGGAPVLWLYSSSNMKAPYTLNAWHFFTVTRDATKTRLYLDSNFISEEVSIPTGILPSVQIGQWRTSSGQWYGGKISDVRIYNRALSQEEVTLLYNNK